MPNKPNADEVLTQKHIRAFTQRGGPRPTNAVRYAGQNEQYLMIDDVDNPVSGGRDPMFVHDPQRRGAYKLVGSSVSTPDFPSTTITFKRKHNALSWVAGDLSCPANFYELAGTCGRPDDFKAGWSDSVTIYSYGQATGRTHQGRSTFDADDQTGDQIEYTFASVYDVGALTFGNVAQVETTRQLVDIAYGGGVECGNCGPNDDGTRRIYALQQTNGTLAANILWSGDGGASWAAVAISGIAAATVVDAIDVAGTTLIVAVSLAAAQGYYIADVNTITGAPGAFTFVTAGFVAAGGPTDIYVAGPNEVYFSGKAGNIYKAADLAAGVTLLATPLATDLTRIHGQGDTLVTVGATNGIVKSNNRGRTWAAPTTGITGTLQAVAVLDDYRYWVGTAAGILAYTVNGGETWVSSTPAGITVISDIVAPTDEVIHIACGASATNARLLTSYDGGASFQGVGNKRIPTLPTFNKANRIALAQSSDPMTLANTLAVAGLAGDAVDGTLLIGRANVL